MESPADLLYVLLAVLGLAGVGLGYWLRTFLRRPSKPSPDPGLSSTDLAERERGDVEELDRALAKKDAELADVLTIPDRDERTKRLAELLRRRGGGWIEGVRPLLLIAVVLVLAYALLQSAGCAPHTPPPVFAEALPAFEPPELAELPPDAPDACAVEPVVPEEPLSFVREGLATCRGVLVPESDVAALLRAEALSEHWLGRSTTCRRYRELDRLLCEAVAEHRYLEGEDARRELRVLRWSSAAGVAAAFVVGVYLGTVLAP